MSTAPAAGALPAPAPEIAPETAEFWTATGLGVLTVQQCADCDTFLWYPRYVCASCHGTRLVYREVSGRGRIYSFTLTTRGIGDYADCGPYVLALVELAEGPKMMTNIVEVDPAALAIGQEVEVVFHDTGQGNALPRFRPRAAG